MARKNKDGIVGGTLVSPSEHLEVMTNKRKKAAAAARVKSEKAAAAQAITE